MDNLKINISHTALVVIDLQKGIMGRKLEPYPANEVIANTARIAEEFRRKGGFVVLVNVSPKDEKDGLRPLADQPMGMKFNEMPKDWARLAPELKMQETDLVITKRQWGAFYGTELDLQLRRRRIDMIVLCGVSTNIGVETTAREAYEYGYNQIFAIDACSALSNEEHSHTEKYIFPKIGRVRKTVEILDAVKNNG